jgi:hypothetical protein
MLLGLVFHLLIGLIAGSIFRIQTLVVLAVAVLVEGVVCMILRGAYAGLVWLLVSQCALQFCYLGGVYLRTILERAGVIVAQSGRRSSDNHVRDDLAPS